MGAPVVVVGAGPVGLTAALLLARRGLAVTVLERQTAAYGQPRAVHLDGEVLRVLQEVGVADDLRGVSRADRRPAAARRRGCGPWPSSPAAGPGRTAGRQTSLFHQPDLDRLLRRAGAPDAADRRPHRLRGGRPGAGGRRRRARRADRAAGGRAARGRRRPRLRRRRQHGPRADRRRAAGPRAGPTAGWSSTSARRRFDSWPGVHQVCDPRRAATFMPGAGDRARWEFRLRARARPPTTCSAGCPSCSRPYGVGDVRGRAARPSTSSGPRWPTAGAAAGCCSPGTPRT